MILRKENKLYNAFSMSISFVFQVKTFKNDNWCIISTKRCITMVRAFRRYMFVNAYVNMALMWDVDVTHDYFINTFPYLIKSLQNVKHLIKFKDEQFGILIDTHNNKKLTLFVCTFYVLYNLFESFRLIKNQYKQYKVFRWKRKKLITLRVSQCI